VELVAHNVTLAYEDVNVVSGLNCVIPPRQITTFIGPNGSGKSTLLRGLARLMKPRAGVVLLDGKEIHRSGTGQVARRLSMLPQRPTAPDGLLVRELVALGRFPYQGFLGALTAEDDRQIDLALRTAGVEALADRPLGELSGGQRQLAWIAMALAQNTPAILLDEPTTFLDIAHQLEVLELLEKLNRDAERTIVMVLHDVNQAARFSHHMVALSQGKIVASGKPEQVITAELMRRVFAIKAEIMHCAATASPLCVPLSRSPG
jgi:iron complex transport system ATP-binding protein